MNLEEILKQVDEWKSIGYLANSTELASQIIRALVERVKEAEEVIDLFDTAFVVMTAFAEEPIAEEFLNASKERKSYLEKWGGG